MIEGLPKDTILILDIWEMRNVDLQNEIHSQVDQKI